MNIYELFSLTVYFLLMMGIGYYAYKKSTSNVSEYMLGGRQLHPAVGALSAGASDMSGWMLMGLPGAVYLGGLNAAWIAVGLTIGAYLNYLYVAPRLRVYTEVANDAITIPDFFEKRFHDNSKLLRTISAVVIVVFFTLYTSAGVVAGGKLFEASFNIEYEIGLFVTAGVVVAYTLFGGFLAVSLTDFVQGLIMFIALIMVPIVTLVDLGGFETVSTQVTLNNADYLNIWPDELTIIGVISLMAWGLGYFGQPHIIVRFMAIRDLKAITTARHIGMTWMIVTVIGAVATGVIGLAYMNAIGADLDDAETIFIVLSQTLFHPILSGFLLAAILAAIMSTISSQLLVSSSSLTEDFYKSFIRRDSSEAERVLVGRISVFAVALIAVFLAFDRSNTILDLVANAWAGFGAAFGPIILLSLYWKRLNRDGALAGMITGATVVLLWIYAPFTINGQPPSSFMYEIIPGFFASGLVAMVVSHVTRAPHEHIQAHYNAMKSHMDDFKKSRAL